MPIIENVEKRSQVAHGRLTPRAPQDKYRSDWAVVEGNAGAGWPSVSDLLDGKSFGEAGEKKIPYTEFKENGKTHDVILHGVKMREMIADIADCKEKEAYEGAISTQRTYVAEHGVNQTASSDGLNIAVKSGLAQPSYLEPNTEGPPDPNPRRRA